ncbi:Phospholipase A-2-activating protein [Operophtera brumata]|uniref:Phospholipase A-2-activating protein n=1 Tax=Operophtera brumata TaxID=104452 RepID=A0A0L7LGV9_OPEBR|nr:Phospholipase A-2-activating protein [Operophtera brumata]
MNAFSDLPGEMLVIAARESILHAIAAASLLLNLSVALAQQGDKSPSKLQIQTKVVSNNQLHNRLKRDSTIIAGDANLKKIAKCSHQWVNTIACNLQKSMIYSSNDNYNYINKLPLFINVVGLEFERLLSILCWECLI